MTDPERDWRGELELEPLLSVDEVASCLRISESGVYRLIRRGDLPVVKVGGRTRFEQVALRHFIASQRRDASTDSKDEEAA